MKIKENTVSTDFNSFASMFLAFKHRKLAFKSPLKTIPRKEGLHVALKGQWWGFRTFFKQLFWSEELGGRFQYSFIFTSTWGNDPIRFIFFGWVETTPTTYELSFEEVSMFVFSSNGHCPRSSGDIEAIRTAIDQAAEAGVSLGASDFSWGSKVQTPMPPPPCKK